MASKKHYHKISQSIEINQHIEISEEQLKDERTDLLQDERTDLFEDEDENNNKNDQNLVINNETQELNYNEEEEKKEAYKNEEEANNMQIEQEKNNKTEDEEKIESIYKSLKHFNQIKTKKYTYEKDFDENGIIYAIGTKFGEEKEWTNPANSMVLIKSITTQMGNKGRGSLADMIGRKGVECYLYSQWTPNAYLTIDFVALRIRPTHYTLRHGKVDGYFVLEHWDFEGSNDEKTWTLIKRHQRDCELEGKQWKTKTWPVNTVHYFRYFRIRMTGKTNQTRDMDQYYFLCCSGFEIYGDIEATKLGNESEKKESFIDLSLHCYEGHEIAKSINFKSRNCMECECVIKSNENAYSCNHINDLTDDNNRATVLCNSCHLQQIAVLKKFVSLKNDESDIAINEFHDKQYEEFSININSHKTMQSCYFHYDKNKNFIQISEFTNRDVRKEDILIGINGKNINKMGLSLKDIQIIFQYHPVPFTATFIREAKANNIKEEKEEKKEKKSDKKKLQSIERGDDEKQFDLNEGLIKIKQAYEEKKTKSFDIKLKLLDLEDFIPFIIEDDNNVNIDDKEENKFIKNGYKAFYDITCGVMPNKIDNFSLLKRFKNDIEFTGNDNEDLNERKAINYNYLYNIIYNKYFYDITTIKTSNIYMNYYFNPIDNNMSKQAFIAMIQIIFTVTMALQVFKDFDAIEMKEITLFNIIYAIFILLLTTSKIIPSIHYLQSDIKILGNYFYINDFNLFLSIVTNVVIALLVPVITFFIILPSEQIIDIVFNSLAIIFVIELDDEGTEDIDYETWFAVNNRKFTDIFIKHFKVDNDCFNPFHDQNKKDGLEKQLNKFWKDMKQNKEVKNGITNIVSYLKDIGWILVGPLYLIYKSFDIIKWSLLRKRKHEDENDKNIEKNIEKIKTKDNKITHNECGNDFVLQGKLLKGLNEFNEALSLLEWNEKEFVYQYDFDTNGIIYGLDNNKLLITSSPMGSINAGYSNEVLSAPANAITGREYVYCCFTGTKSNPGYFTVEFQDVSICPTHYTLRVGSYWSYLRNWSFEAYDNTKGEWKHIKQHINDTRLNEKGAVATWAISNCDKHYNKFRITMNERNQYNLYCSGFEIYGNVKKKRDEQKPSKILKITSEETNETNEEKYEMKQEREMIKYEREEEFIPYDFIINNMILQNRINCLIKRGEIEKELCGITYCNPSHMFNNALNDIKQCINKTPETYLSQIEIYLNLYQYKNAKNVYEEMSEINNVNGCETFMIKKIKNLIQTENDTLQYSENKKNATVHHQNAVNLFNVFINTISEYNIVKKDNSFNDLLTFMNKECDKAIECVPKEYTNYLFKWQINKCLLIQINKMIRNLKQQIIDTEYKSFYRFIYDQCIQMRQTNISSSKCNHFIYLMIFDNKLTKSTFMGCRKKDFCDMIQKYCADHVSAPKLWDAIKVKLETETEALSSDSDFEEKLNLLESKRDELQIESEELCKKTSFYGSLNNCEKDNENGIDICNKNIEQYPNQPEFYWMRACLYLSTNELQNAVKDFNTAYSMNPQNPIFVYWMGTISNRVGKHEDALKFYTVGFDMLSDKLTNLFMHSLESKIYIAFYECCTHNKENNNDLIIKNNNNDLHFTLFITKLSKIFDKNKGLVDFIIDNISNDNNNNSLLSLQKLHNIFEFQLLLNEIPFYKWFQNKLMNWQQCIKYTQSYELVNGILFECCRSDNTWNIKTLLIAAMKTIYHKTDKFYYDDDPFPIEQLTILHRYLPSFYRKIWEKYYTVDNERGDKYWDKIYLLWEQELNRIADRICINIKQKVYQFGDILKETDIESPTQSLTVEVHQNNEFDTEELEKVETIYGPLFDGPLNERKKNLLKCIYFGKKKQIPFIQNIMDTKYRLINETQTHIHINKMPEILFAQTPNRDTYGHPPRDKYNIINASVFYDEFGSDFIFEGNKLKINDNMNDYYEYMLSIIQFIKEIITVNNTPFQFDFWIIPKKIESDSDDKDKDETENENKKEDKNKSENENKDEEKQEIDKEYKHKSDIENLLEQNNLNYITYSDISNKSFLVTLKKMYHEFSGQLAEICDKNPPKNRRFCMIIDRRRDSNDNIKLYIYNPTSKCNHFSIHNLSEEYMERSLKSLFKSETWHSLFTSIHIQSINTIKCYQYFNKKGGRFYAIDMVNVWPKWFNMNNNENKQFITRKLDLNKIQLRDDNFIDFYIKYTQEFRDNKFSLAEMRNERKDKARKLLKDWGLDKYAGGLIESKKNWYTLDGWQELDMKKLTKIKMNKEDAMKFMECVKNTKDPFVICNL